MKPTVADTVAHGLASLSDESADSIYRAPAEGMALVPARVPDLRPGWRCRWFGHRLHAKFNDTSGYAEFPSKRYPPSLAAFVWCTRCGTEWKR